PPVLHGVTLSSRPSVLFCRFDHGLAVFQKLMCMELIVWPGGVYWGIASDRMFLARGWTMIPWITDQVWR
ncbi:MAG TPA: hypothetical protein PL002_16850, partial [Flavobacteriales bacterium]|nr:hypothetical protein [Flavobacteriales bacterium]